MHMWLIDRSTCMILFCFILCLFSSLVLWGNQQHGGLLTAYRNPQPILRPSPISSPTLVVPVSLIICLVSPSEVKLTPINKHHYSNFKCNSRVIWIIGVTVRAMVRIVPVAPHPALCHKASLQPVRLAWPHHPPLLLQTRWLPWTVKIR